MTGQIDPRDRKLAQMIVEYSVAAAKGDLVMIECVGASTLGLGGALVEAAARVEAAPYLVYRDPAIQRSYLLNATEAGMQRLSEFERVQMENTTCYVGIRGSDNIFEEADVPSAQKMLYMKYIRQPVHLDIRVNKTRWCVLRYPNPAMAQLAGMSTAQFADFYYSVCLVDYARMEKAARPLGELMRRTNKVEIVGPGETHLVFSIEGVDVKECNGNYNVPDGECFTAPVRESIEGVVQFNTPTSESGVAYENVRLRFEKGRAVEATAANETQTRQLNEVLDRDEGARYVGEFAIGYNPLVREPMRDILFDEKIAGSFHMALGNCYEDAPNGNKSSLHWDLVCIQRPEYGGGEIRFDGRTIRKDGLFVVDELKGLNPEALA